MLHYQVSLQTAFYQFNITCVFRYTHKHTHTHTHTHTRAHTHTYTHTHTHTHKLGYKHLHVVIQSFNILLDQSAIQLFIHPVKNIIEVLSLPLSLSLSLSPLSHP